MPKPNTTLSGEIDKDTLKEIFDSTTTNKILDIISIKKSN